MDWEPTMNLRFVELPLILGKNGERLSGGHVLQQQWLRRVSGVDEHGAYWTDHTEWRDVPLVMEGEE